MTQTRAEWQAMKDEENRRTGSWGFDPGMPWSVANWRERVGIVFFYGMMGGVVFPAMVLGGLWFIGGVIEGISQHNMEHDRCLKRATNGYEIKQCH